MLKVVDKKETKDRKERKVGVEDMMKADIWAFGCVMMEVLFFCTPVFYSVGCGNQLRSIEKFVNGQNNGEMNISKCVEMLLG